MDTDVTLLQSSPPTRNPSRAALAGRPFLATTVAERRRAACPAASNLFRGRTQMAEVAKSFSTGR
jgi:hypothetical protein